MLLLLLFGHSAKSSIAQSERLQATSPLLVTRLHLPLAIVVRLHVRKSNVVILTPETAVTVGVGLVVGLSMGVAQSTPQGVHCQADAIYLLP